MKKLFFPLILAAMLAVPVVTMAAQGKVIEQFYKGISLASILRKNKAKYNVGFPSPRQGIESLRRAIEVIYKKSPFSAAKLEILKKAGQITIAYDPSFEEGKTGSFALAAFFPEFYNKGITKDGKKSKKKWFVVKVGRQAIKWPPDELAMIIVHELVGHGIQKLRGRMKYIRDIDLECAANLYGERFYQDIKIDKHSDNVVDFRRSLENRWCSDFKHYMRRVKPQMMGMWDVLNPNVPKLLDIFDQYVKYRYSKGDAKKSIAAEKKILWEKNQKLVRNIEARSSAEEQYKLGIALRQGLGVKQDATKALKWFREAAEQNNTGAQVQLAEMYASGQGTKKNLVTAGFWLSLAVSLTPPGSSRDALAQRRDRLIAKLSRAQRDSIWKNVKKQLVTVGR